MQIKLLTDTAKVPTRGSVEAAGYDIYCDQSNADVEFGQATEISTGLAVKIPVGFVGLIQPRSGLAFSFGLHTMAGVIDSDYTGEVKVLMTCHVNDGIYCVNRGDKIAQMIVVPCYTRELEVVDCLGESERGTKGFGSSGK